MSGERLTGLERRGLADVLRSGVTGDPAVLQIAAGQLGAISRRQVLAVGISEDQIDHRLARRRWTRAHRGVYVLGPPALIEWQAEMAGVLAVGKATLLGADSALAAYGLRAKPRGNPTVLAMARDPRAREGIDIVRAPLLDHRDTRWFKGIPIVSPALALLDSAPGLTQRELAQAVATGYRRNILRRVELVGILKRLPGRRGAAAIRELLASESEPVFTRSQLEEMALALIRRAGFPLPEVNRLRGEHEVDLIWRAQRFILELDGHPFHSLRSDRERDYERDDSHQLAGFHVARATGRQVRDEPERTTFRIARGLIAGGLDVWETLTPLPH